MTQSVDIVISIDTLGTRPYTLPENAGGKAIDMAEVRVERRMTVILAADVAG
jgi:hypothetical protein